MNPGVESGRRARSRIVSVGWMALGICLGLLLRSRWISFPGFVAKYGGDALWALVVFYACGFLAVRWSTGRVALVSLGIAWGIEALQLYHAPWIDAIRSTRPGHWVLGSTFNPPDLFAYAIGVAGGVWIEWVHRNALLDGNGKDPAP